MNYRVRLLIATVSILLLTIIITGCDEKANISENTTPSNMTGKITAIDNDRRLRFLVVSPDKFLKQDKKMPDAVWYEMRDNADIEYKGKAFKAENVKIGSTVKVWSEGIMFLSYPGQTGGIRLEITAIDSGKGDASGRVTGIEKTGEGVNETWIIEVDGVKYQLLSIYSSVDEGNTFERL